MSKTEAQSNRLTRSHRVRGARDKREPNFLGPTWNLRLIFSKSMEPNSKNNSLFQWLLERFKFSTLQVCRSGKPNSVIIHCVCSVYVCVCVCVCVYVYVRASVCVWCYAVCNMYRSIYSPLWSCDMFLKCKVILFL